MRAYNVRMLERTIISFTLLGLLSGIRSVPAQETFDIEDYFPLSQDSQWHYTGEGQPGSSPEDDFTWTVLPELKNVGGGRMATRMQTITDEPDDARNMDEDFWFVDTDGSLYFYGFRNGQADTGFPAQDIVLDDPVLIGGRGQRIGDVVTDTGSGQVIVSVPVLGQQTVTGTITAEITYQEFVPFVDTPLGRFTHVLRMILDLTGSAIVQTPFGPQNVGFPIRTVELYLKDGLGMILQDQDADPNDAEVQIIDQGRVAGVPIVGEPENAADDWELYQ